MSNSVPLEIRQIFEEYLDKGMTFKEYCELIGEDELVVKMKIRAQVPRNTYFRIRKVYFETEEDEEEDMECLAPAYKIIRFDTGRYGVFKKEKFQGMIEFPQGFITPALPPGKYYDIIDKGGLEWIISKIHDGYTVKEISDYYGIKHSKLRSFIKHQTGINSMVTFQKKYRGDYLKELE